MVADHHGGPHAIQILSAGDDFEADVRGVAHAPFEGAGGGVLGEVFVAREAEEDGGEGAVDGAEGEGEQGGEGAGVEGGAGGGDGEEGEDVEC